jgi:hypothetical protein
VLISKGVVVSIAVPRPVSTFRGPAKIRPKGVTALLMALSGLGRPSRLTRQGLQSASDGGIWCRSPLEIRFSGTRTRLLPLFGLCWLLLPDGLSA